MGVSWRLPAVEGLFLLPAQTAFLGITRRQWQRGWPAGHLAFDRSLCGEGEAVGRLCLWPSSGASSCAEPGGLSGRSSGRRPGT